MLGLVMLGLVVLGRGPGLQAVGFGGEVFGSGIRRFGNGPAGNAVGLAGIGHALTNDGFHCLIASHDHLFPASLPASARQAD